MPSRIQAKTLGAKWKTTTNPVDDWENRDPKLLDARGNSGTRTLDARGSARTILDFSGDTGTRWQP